jgi:uncharacterized glyoxalase superfamily protein PhnB
MFKTKYAILIWSENPDNLAKFYSDVLKLELVEKTDIPAKDGLDKDYGYNFRISETNILWIGHHNEIKGKNKDPFRHMFNLTTDEVQKWYEIVKEAGCKIIQKPIETPFSTVDNPWYVCTWLDPENNCWQFMGKI